jgi:type IV pilus assembly protein PilM
VFESIAAIDIGSSYVKLVLARRGFRDFHITDLIDEPVSLSSDSLEEAQAKAIGRLLEKQGIKGTHPLVNLPMDKAIIRHLSFPFTDKARIAEAIPFEAQENIPFDINDLDMDFQHLDDEKEESGRVLVAATHAETISELIPILQSYGIQPYSIGLESNALHECYSYFSFNDDENVLLVDIGHSKTIVNILRNNILLYTRCIIIGTGGVITEIADSLKISPDDARAMFEKLRLDISDFEATVTRGGYKNFGLTKPKLRTIFNLTKELADDLGEQILLTIKSFIREFGVIEFDRILFSGGGSKISGIGEIIGKQTEIKAERAEYPIAVGMALSHFTHGKSCINFLKGDFRPSYLPSIGGQFRLSILFGSTAIAILLINFLLSFIISSISSRKTDEMLENQFRRYFSGHSSNGNPVATADKIVSEEKKDYKVLTDAIPPKTKMLLILQDVTSQFRNDPQFQLKNFVVDNEKITIDGETGSGGSIDAFKNKLVESNKFDSVTLNTSMSRSFLVNFSISIKLKRATNKR